MSFYTRHPFDSLLLSNPFLVSSRQPQREEIVPRLGHGVQRTSSIPAVRAFSPNFDVHETAKEYVLEGELPGLDDKDKNKNLSIEFTDGNTMVIRGKIERSYTRGTPPAPAAAAGIEGPTMRRAINESPAETMGEEKKAEKVEARKEEEQKKKKKKRAEEEEESVKYWVSERTVGSFQRSFSFPGDIDQENVKATLQNGILKVIVPKMEKRGTRRIDIS